MRRCLLSFNEPDLDDFLVLINFINVKTLGDMFDSPVLSEDINWCILTS